MTADSYIRAQYLLNLIGPDVWPNFLCHVTLKLAVSRSQPSVPQGANFCILLVLLAVNCFNCSLTDLPALRHRPASYDWATEVELAEQEEEAAR